MTIQFRFFTIPITGSNETETELNRFLRSKRVLTVHKEFLKLDNDAFWCLAVEYLDPNDANREDVRFIDRKKRIDYKNVLSPEDFAVFVELREWRKHAAEKDAVPVYAIFTNEHLAAIAQNRIDTLSGLQSIDGIGEARIKKYGHDVIELIKRLSGKNKETPL